MADTGQEKIGYTLVFIVAFLSMFIGLVAFMPPALLSQTPDNSYAREYPSSFDAASIVGYSFYVPINGANLSGNSSGSTYKDWIGNLQVTDAHQMNFGKTQEDMENEDAQIRVYYFDHEFEGWAGVFQEAPKYSGGFLFMEYHGSLGGRKYNVVTMDEVISHYDYNRGFSYITIQGFKNYVFFVQPHAGYSISDAWTGHANIYMGESTELDSVSGTDAFSLIAKFFTFSMPYTGEPTIDAFLNIAITGPITVLLIYLAIRLVALFIPFT